MQSILLGELADYRGRAIAGWIGRVKGCVSPSQSNKVSLFLKKQNKTKKHETEQSEKSQSGDVVQQRAEVVNEDEGSVKIKRTMSAC